MFYDNLLIYSEYHVGFEFLIINEIQNWNTEIGIDSSLEMKKCS